MVWRGGILVVDLCFVFLGFIVEAEPGRSSRSTRRRLYVLVTGAEGGKEYMTSFYFCLMGLTIGDFSLREA